MQALPAATASAAAAAAIGLPSAALASRYGEYANLGFSLEENDSVARNQMSGQGRALYDAGSGAGTALYDEASRAKEKTAAIVARWQKMTAEVAKALGKATPAYPVAQSALDNNMNALKTDMRTVSKALSGGDITVRDTTKGGVDQPRFDYNTGQFELQPTVKKAEEVFAVINDLYFNGIKAKGRPSDVLQKLERADGLFNEWLAMVS